MTVIAMLVSLFKGYCCNTLSRNNAGATEVRRVNQAINPTFELETVHKQYFSRTNGAGISRRRLVDVRISVVANKRCQSDVIPSYLFDQIA